VRALARRRLDLARQGIVRQLEELVRADLLAEFLRRFTAHPPDRLRAEFHKDPQRRMTAAVRGRRLQSGQRLREIDLNDANAHETRLSRHDKFAAAPRAKAASSDNGPARRPARRARTAGLSSKSSAWH
jgi:hypothetical protein